MDKQEPSYYSILTADVRYDPELTPTAKLLFSEITALSNKHGYCFASNAYFAKLFCKIKNGEKVPASNRTISRTISSLRDHGHIFVVFDDDGERRLIPSGCKADYDKLMGGTTKKSTRHDKNVLTPHDKNVVHNNTRVNTTVNNLAVEVFELFKHRLPSCRQLENPKETKVGREALEAIVARATERGWGSNIEPWTELFDLCGDSIFLMSQPWFGLEWLVEHDHFVLTLSGKYNNSRSSGAAVEQDRLSPEEADHYGSIG